MSKQNTTQSAEIARLEKELNAAIAERDAADKQHAELKRELSTNLPVISAQEHQRVHDAIVSAQMRGERAAARVTALSTELERARAREAADALRAEYRRLEAEAEEIGHTYKGKYIALANQLLALLSGVKSLDDRIVAMNDNLPADCDPLATVEERCRHVPGKPARVEIVDVECTVFSGPVVRMGDAERLPKERRKVERTIPAEAPVRPAPLYEIFQLDGFAHDDDPIRVPGTVAPSRW